MRAAAGFRRMTSASRAQLASSVAAAGDAMTAIALSGMNPVGPEATESSARNRERRTEADEHEAGKPARSPAGLPAPTFRSRRLMPAAGIDPGCDG